MRAATQRTAGDSRRIIATTARIKPTIAPPTKQNRHNSNPDENISPPRRCEPGTDTAQIRAATIGSAKETTEKRAGRFECVLMQTCRRPYHDHRATGAAHPQRFGDQLRQRELMWVAPLISTSRVRAWHQRSYQPTIPATPCSSERA